ncbi:MAG: DUF4907 domain-containing protein [Crocinitomicaceae bacterium]
MRVIQLLLILCLISCSSETVSDNPYNLDQEEQGTFNDYSINKTISETSLSPEYTAEAIHDVSIGWGYKIYQNGKQYINQPHIPAISGKKGFENKEDALKTANFVINKLENGIVPPTINIIELDSLGVLK